MDFDTFCFLEKLRASKELPKTSAPPPEMFSSIFCIHPSWDLSGNARSAETAKINFPDLKERTLKKAIEKIKSLVSVEYPLKKEGYLSIIHADHQALAEELSSYFTNRLNTPQSLISFLPPAIIRHAEPGSIAVGFFK